ncbi:transposase [Streptomyces sp. NPDC005134]|uniref:transposase n=1 Tax=Streptomyces sp. NPDC005065 TaxID=3154461 RepID=UPI0033B8FCB4
MCAAVRARSVGPAGRRGGALPHRLQVRRGHGAGRSRLSPQCAGRLPRPSHRGRPRRPPPRPRAGLPEGGRSGARAHYTAHRLHPRPGRGPRPDPAGDGHRGGPRESTRTVGFPPQELRDLQLRVRAEQQTPEWKTRYAVRSGVEGTVNEFAHGHGMRRCRYRK